MKARQYILGKVEFSGEAFRRNNRKVLNHSTCGVITLPLWMIGQEFDLILIPKEKNAQEVKA